jgi:hypothetical protein
VQVLLCLWSIHNLAKQSWIVVLHLAAKLCSWHPDWQDKVSE